ncbi:E3 ubiquitin-protein ligase RNF180 isoform X2 [Eubalaena glacialis]|uniref:E3 ubiquitin-protein ligase RNF180 isoform X2 n=1 Tax=Eubalaena glacialis TaxID=27606 RepID=UPI002A5A4C9E|nr:E3 ubiquitin-protein ligase RNF180 isoform X2 [Eubalaena glacialis]
MKRSKELITKNHNQEEISILRCWKCRKCIAGSGCFMECLEHQVTKDRHDSADDQNICHVWHMDIEALPEWIHCLIQKAQWTVGKLNCPFCGARLGGFNFVSTPKCSCGQLAAVHLSKSRTDYQPTRSGRLMRPSLKYLSHPRVQSGCDKETLLTGGASKNRNHGLLNMAQNNNGPGRLTEALCLEVRSTYFKMKNEKLLFKASDPKYQLFVPQLVTGRCTTRAFHRKSHSLDLNISEKLTLLPTLYEIHSKTTVYPRLNETQPVDLSGLPLESSKNNRSFQISSSFDPNMLLQRFSVAPRETQTQRGGEFQCGLEASAVYSGHASSNNLTFLMDMPSAGRSTLEAPDQEEHLSPLDFLHSGSFSLGAINQRLSKREKSKLKNLRRKQRRHERWLQKQTLDNEMSTDDDNEYAEEKESYICAVCLDVYFNPYMCYPCHHIFCEPCLRTLAKDNPASTPCPLCRTIISRVFFQTELNNATKTFFTKEYLKRKQSFQKSSSAKWPLPSRRKAFHLFGGVLLHIILSFRTQDDRAASIWYTAGCGGGKETAAASQTDKCSTQKQHTAFSLDSRFRLSSLVAMPKGQGSANKPGFHRRAAPVTRRQFPHGAHRMDYLHFEDDSRGWWFDMDMVIIYIYSVNWVIGFIVFCFLCYFFFPF